MTPIPPVLALAFNMPTLLILLALALLIFGSRLPSLGKNLGKSIVSFKKGMKEGAAPDDDEEEEDDDDDEIEEAPKKKKKELAGKTTETVGAREKEKVAQADDE